LALPSDPVRLLRCGVRRDATTRLPTRHGEFAVVAYVDVRDGREHLALIGGALGGDVTVRVHSECLTGDVFGSQRCDCGEQLDASLGLLARDGGVLVYLRQEGRGIGLLNKLRAYALQDGGQDTVEANRALGFHDDPRDYAVAAGILHDLGVRRVRLLTNNPRKVRGLEDGGIVVAERVPLVIPPNDANRRYLETKQVKLGHLLG